MVNNYMKICNECNIEKENCEFYSGFNKCKLCIKEIRKEYYIRNSNKIKERVSKYQKENREACNEGYRERRKRNPDVYKKISKRYYDSHREQKLAYARKHREREIQKHIKHIVVIEEHGERN